MLLDPVTLQPRAQRVAQRIEALVRQQGLQPGDRLPAERELSRLLGVTHATVRQANDVLIRRGLISREHGRGTYVRSLDLLGRRKRASARPLTVGYLTVGTERGGYTLNQYQRMEAVAQDADVRVVFGSVPANSSASVPRSFLKESVEGMVVDGNLDAPTIRRLAELGMPMVVAGNHPIVPGTTSVRMDVVEMYRGIVAELARHGHKTIWLSIEPLRLYYTREMFEGYRQGLREVGVGPELVILGEHDPAEQLVEQFALAYKTFGPRQAIIHSGGYEPLLSKLAARGIDLSQLDIVASGQVGRPAWGTTYDWPIADLGHEAPRRLLKLLRGESVNSLAYTPTVSSRQVEGHVQVAFQWRSTELEVPVAASADAEA